MILFLVFTSFIIAVTGAQKSLTAEQIVGANSTAIDKYPYLASIEMNNSYFCAGTILSQWLVLTTASCLSKPHTQRTTDCWIVRSGKSFTKSDDISVVKKVILHEGYGYNRNSTTSKLNKFHGSNSENDLAILVLEKPLVFNSFRSYVNLVDANFTLNWKETGTVVGWNERNEYGFTSNRIQYASLPVYSQLRCSMLYDTRQIQISLEKRICAGTKGTNVCIKDEGAPLIINGLQAGIATSVTNCGANHLPAVFIDVAAYRPWIDGNILRYYNGAEKEKRTCQFNPIN